MAADNETMGMLHELFAEAGLEILKEFKKDPTSINPQLLKTVKDFLKDNNIETDVVPGTPLAALAKEYPFEDMDDTDIPH